MKKWKCVSTMYINDWVIGKTYTECEPGRVLNEKGDSVIIDLISETTKFKEVTQFTKADLKPCMVVVQRSGDIKIVAEYENGMVIVNESGLYGGLEYYDEDMICCDDLKSLDIMQVYGFSVSSCAANVISINNRPLLWERIEESPTQLKLEELENKQREIADEIKKIREEME